MNFGTFALLNYKYFSTRGQLTFVLQSCSSTDNEADRKLKTQQLLNWQYVACWHTSKSVAEQGSRRLCFPIFLIVLKLSTLASVTSKMFAKRWSLSNSSRFQSYASRGSLHAQFIQQAKATPDAVAVVDEKGVSHTYQELDEESTHLAALLVSKGLKRNKCAAIYMSRTYEYTLSYISILKAGECSAQYWLLIARIV